MGVCQQTMLTIACLLMSEHGQGHKCNAGSRLWFSFGVKAQTEMMIWCVKGMYMLKVASRVLIDDASLN